MSKALTLQSAAFAVAGAELLSPMDFSLSGQGITAVMGANGAGKSLFLRLIHGLITPTSGKVLWDDRSAAETVQSRGFVFQDNPVLRRSVAQNVAFPLKAAGLDNVAPRVLTALENARLADKAHLPAAQLSGGQRQRMAVARALVADPEVLLLDEPSASLDPASTKALEEMVLQAVQNGVRVIIATHDLGQAKRLADEVIFFAHGSIAEHSAATSFFDAPVSEAARNYFEGRL